MDPLSRTRELARRYFDRLASEAELAELQRLLQSSPAAADAFANLARLESDLTELFAQQQDIRREAGVLEAIERQQSRRRWLGHGVRVALAASVLLAIVATLFWWLNRSPDGPEARTGPEVLAGQIEHADGVVRVMSPQAELRLADGSRLRLEKDSEVVLPALVLGMPRVVELRRGAGRFLVTSSDDEFQVETPAGRVTALGTEFSVELTEGDQEMKTSQLVLAVMVWSGMVQVDVGGGVELLSTGQSSVYGQERKLFVIVRRQARAVVVSAGDGKLTVTVGGERNRTEKTFEVGDSVKVSVDGKPAKLSDLTRGSLVILEMGPKDGDGLTAVRAEGPTIAATVKSVAKDKITVQGQRKADSIDYPLTDKVKVTIDGKEGKLEDLKAGDRVGLGLSVDRKTVMAIVKGRGEGDKGRVGGQVKAIDLKAGTITLPGGRQGDRVFQIAKDAKVTVGEKAAKLEDIKVGNAVQLVLDKDGKTETITVNPGRKREADRDRPGNVGGEVKEIDLKARTITMEGGREAGGGTYPMAKEIKLSANNVKVNKLEDIKAGMLVMLTLDKDGKTVTAITVSAPRERPRRERPDARQIPGAVVKEVDAKAATITIQVGRRSDGKFSVAKDAKVTIDGKEARLEDVKAGVTAMLVLDKEGKTVTAITVGQRKRDRE